MLLVQSMISALRDRRGISAVEYAVLAVGIVAAVAAGSVLVGSKLTTIFTQVAAAL